jgi:mono/diheme cytochrome c family protein
MSKLRPPVLLLALALCAGAVGAHAVETGSPARGHDLARGVCAECHAVEDLDSFSPVIPAPTFREIAAAPGMTATALSAALRTSHQEMPNLNLSSEEIADLTAYILSLKGD